MARNPEHGAGWEIRREFVDPEKAARAGKEVLGLIESGSKYFSTYDYNPPGTSGVTFCNLAAWSPSQYPEQTDTIQNDPDAMKAVRDIIDIHRRTEKVISEKVRSAQFNIYEPGGHTRSHRDRRRGEIFALGLLGVAQARIKDPVFGTWHEFEINPGDGVHFVNPRAQRLRPYHQFINISNARRVSIVA